MAMGSPLSPAPANMKTEWLEETALSTAQNSPRMWKRYVDDTFAIYPHGADDLTEFLSHLNSISPTIRFPMEMETDGNLPFLDTLVTREENKLTTYYSVLQEDTHWEIPRLQIQPYKRSKNGYHQMSLQPGESNK